MSTRNAVIVRDLIKIYKLGAVEVQALRGLNVNVRRGEMISIIGPSGSGKTTLLNIIGGLDRATAGTIRVFDKDLSKMSTSDLVNFRREMVGHVFQNMNLVPTLTAAENIELPMAALGIPREERHHKPGELSGGEQQRIARASALANDPPLILADEPTGELDTENARIVVEYLRRINQDMGKTVIMVTHDPNIARISDRILRIHDGVVQADVASLGESEVATADYTKLLRDRISEVEVELAGLDSQFKQGVISGDEYVKRQTQLKNVLSVLTEELHRLGVVK